MRAHLLVYMLAYFLEWHLRRQLAPLLFSEEGEPRHAGGPVGPLQRSESAQRKDRTRRTVDGSLPVQSLAALLAGLGTLGGAELKYEQVPGYAVPTLSELEPLHERVFELLGLQPYPAPAPSKAVRQRRQRVGQDASLVTNGLFEMQPFRTMAHAAGA